MQTKRDVREEVTRAIIEKLEQGVMPWRKGWGAPDAVFDLPRNAVSERPYSGGNKLYLLMVQQGKGYHDPRFLTFKQAQDLGGSVIKNERGYPVEYWDRMPFWKRRDVVVTKDGEPIYVRDVVKEQHDMQPRVIDKDGNEHYTNTLKVRLLDDKTTEMSWFAAQRQLDLMFAKHAVVFNVQQCSGLEKFLESRPLPSQAKRAEHELDEQLQRIVGGMEKTGLRIEHRPQDRAFYSPGTDRIVLPMISQFHDVSEYRSTLLHELGHATGHESRLKRDLGNGFGTKAYAREELVAELASAFMAAHTGIERKDDQHAAYIASWLDVLKSDNGKLNKHAIFEAAREADRACEYMIEKAAELERDKTQHKHKAQDVGQEVYM
jgi:antirestriction protein ArdC